MTNQEAAATVAALSAALRAQGHEVLESYSTDWGHWFGTATLTVEVAGLGQVWLSLRRTTGNLRMECCTPRGYRDHRDNLQWLRPAAAAASVTHALSRWAA